jgi:hypothetical protein
VPFTIRTRGPYDYRLGYASLPRFTSRLEASGDRIAEQARDSNSYMLLTGLGLYPMYREKDQTGLEILDGAGQPIYTVHYPARIYLNPSEIPSLVVNTLLFIENRDLLDARHPYLNPALEWSRLSRAVVQYSVHQVDHDIPRIGGSTLAGHAVGEDPAFPERQDPFAYGKILADGFCFVARLPKRSPDYDCPPRRALRLHQLHSTSRSSEPR